MACKRGDGIASAWRSCSHNWGRPLTPCPSRRKIPAARRVCRTRGIDYPRLSRGEDGLAALRVPTLPSPYRSTLDWQVPQPALIQATPRRRDDLTSRTCRVSDELSRRTAQMSSTIAADASRINDNGEVRRFYFMHLGWCVNRTGPSSPSGRVTKIVADPSKQQHDSGTVRPHGALELARPEPGLFIAGMKSCGGAPTFLLATGYEQVPSIAAYLAGDIDSDRRIELDLPQTGVCSNNVAQISEEGYCRPASLSRRSEPRAAATCCAMGEECEAMPAEPA